MLRLLTRRVLPALLLLLLLFAAGIAYLSSGWSGVPHARGAIVPGPLPDEVVAARAQRQRATAEGREDAILFGDLHVHTTYSGDAYVFSLPLMQGEGAHPPADACDFARYCAELDFWSINDHAEFLTPFQWSETRLAIEECNAAAGDPSAPDLVSFLGWEWTQSAPAVAGGDRAHYGHKNVILRDYESGSVPERPIGAGSGGLFSTPVPGVLWALARATMTLGDLGDLEPYHDFNRYTREVAALDACPEGVSSPDLPADCLEGAPTPEVLFRKLDEWGFPGLVIPHGTTWGIHAPPGAELGIQLEPGMHDPKRQLLFETYSGHGNSERFRDLRDTTEGPAGEAVCAAPSDGYLPCCWRAGELIRERCGEIETSVCEARVERARAYALEAGARFRGVVAGSQPDDWLECGQLAGTFQPALDYRPGMSAQYGLAARRPEQGEAGAFRYGLIASSDNHKARAGAGYKEIERKAFGDAYGLRQDWLDRLAGDPPEPSAEPVPPDEISLPLAAFDPGTERAASYYYTAGLVAVHAPARDRHTIFEALRERRAYGTSGPRILLWFDLENGPRGRAAMGSVVRQAQAPRFRVRAAGAFEQLPGCPTHTRERMAPERLTRLCRDECYHPSDVRHPITRLEVVRIRPQRDPGEPIAALIEDPWRVFPCAPGREACAVSFEDPDYDAEREFLYYVRAIQAPTPAVNGDPMRCTRDQEGRCLEARLCPAGGPGFDPADDCTAPVEERAWSSPIWLRPPPQS